MGKSIPSAEKFQQLARVITSKNTIKHPVPSTQLKPTRSITPADPLQLSLKSREMAAPETSDPRQRTPLAEVVADCVNRWFQDTLKEAKKGDSAMQVLVGQMYYSGYGVERNAQKGRTWINRASKSRSSALKVGDKQPGYDASDSDSDEVKEEAV